MPELPEVETLRRMLEDQVVGRTIASAWCSGARLRGAVPRGFGRLRGLRIGAVRRLGKYLLIDLSGGLTLLSHLGMSGRWRVSPGESAETLEHVHAILRFTDQSTLVFQDPRRFGLLRLRPTARLASDRSLAILGPDPLLSPPTGEFLAALASGARASVKNFLLDQRRLAGIGNIYASEILHRAGVEPRRRAGALSRREWEAVAAGTTRVLREAIGRMGTTFSTYRTLWNEPGGYGERLRVYDRAGEPCRRCLTPIRRIVQGQRSTFYCPACQPRRGGRSEDGRRSRRRPGGGPVRRQRAGSRPGPSTSAASRNTENPSPAGRNRAGTSS